MWSVYLYFRWGAVLGQGEEDSNTGTKELRGANSTQVTVDSAECQSMTCACDGIPRRLQPETHLHFLDPFIWKTLFFTNILFYTALGIHSLVKAHESDGNGEIGVIKNLHKPG